MTLPPPYDPATVFAPGDDPAAARARVFIAPQRYVQGEGVLDNVGRYLRLLNVRHVGILMSARGQSSEGPRVRQSLASENIEGTCCDFNGECSLDEIEAHRDALADRVDGLIAVGGGKCVDAGKSIAFRLGIPVVIVPTLASNDAPCSALSVLYEPSGIYAGVEFYPQSPALVVVDTALVAAAPERFLVAGMGDAMATWYEARACLTNPNGVNGVGTRPTIASYAMGEACAHTLFEEGVRASAAVRGQMVDESLEKIVEANTLLSGLGFESGGIALAHGIAKSCTALSHVREHYLHGEMVAIGTLVQLALESRLEEVQKVARFFVSVGLPANLEQLSLDVADASDMNTLIEGTMDWPHTLNMPFVVDAGMIRDALVEFDKIGTSVIGEFGDENYRRLHIDSP